MKLDKGKLSIGDDADITIFDINKIRENADFDRPLLPPEGIEYVIVNGEVVVENKELLRTDMGEFITDRDY